MLPLMLLLFVESAVEAADAANERLVRCYFGVVRASGEALEAASLDRELSARCTAEEAALRNAGKRRLQEMGRSAEQSAAEIDELIRSVRGGLAANAARQRYR